MHDQSSSRGQGVTGAQPQSAPMQGEALARRRLLLKGLSRGGAVAAAVAAPVSSFAVPSGTVLVTDPNNTMCSQSGQQSLVHSGAPGTRTTCAGHRPSYYVATNPSNGAPVAVNWPTAFNDQLTVGALLGASGNATTDAKSVLTVLATEGSSDLAYWIAAAFNSLIDTGTFPYTLAEVQTQYQSGVPTLINLYRQFLSSLG